MLKKTLTRTFALFAIILIAFVSVTPINVSAAWAKDSKENYYYKDDAGKCLRGFQSIGGKTYFFGKNGKMYTNKWVTTTSGNKYYFRKDGTMATGKIKLNGKVYEFDSSGKLISFDIWAPFNGLEWGMTSKEAIKALNLKKGDYTYPEDFKKGDLNVMAVLDKSNEDSSTLYLFDKKSGLVCFSYKLTYSDTSFKGVKEGFENGGFEFFEEDESDKTYSAVYTTDNCIGILSSYDGVISYAICPIDALVNS